MCVPHPFRYPVEPHVRRHGPLGYADAESYRDWLRDEFVFRCCYCLRRECWGRLKGEFDIDHLLPRTLRPDLVTEYDNLVYCCHTCNLAKGVKQLPDPHHLAYGRCVRVNHDGTISPLNEQGEILIDELKLNKRTTIQWRRLYLDGVRLAAACGDTEYLGALLGLPAELPDLVALKPPGGNSRATGSRMSWHARRQHGEVPAFIE